MNKRVFCLLLMLWLLCAGCGAQAPSTEAAQTTAPTVVTEAPTIPTTVPVETTAPILWGEEIHSGLREDGTFSEGTVFIGDSLTAGLLCQYLMPQQLVGDAWYMAKVGAPLRAFLNQGFLMEKEDSTYSWAFYEQSYMRSVATVGESATAVYFMLGTNYDYNNNADSYIQAVDYLLETCPNATVYLQLIPYSGSELVRCQEVNDSLRAAYQHYRDQGIQRVMVIDTYTGIGENTQPDGVHLTVDGYRLWYETLVRFAEENQIPQ